MVFAARYEDPPAVWGVGRVVVGDQVHPWPVSASDIDDETESMAEADTGQGCTWSTTTTRPTPQTAGGSS